MTTLVEAAVYRVADRAELYRRRWQVETALAQLQTTMQMEGLHGQTVRSVLKELTVFAIVYNLVRMVILQSGDTPTHRRGAEQLPGCPAVAQRTKSW